MNTRRSSSRLSTRASTKKSPVHVPTPRATTRSTSVSSTSSASSASKREAKPKPKPKPSTSKSSKKRASRSRSRSPRKPKDESKSEETEAIVQPKFEELKNVNIKAEISSQPGSSSKAVSSSQASSGAQEDSNSQADSVSQASTSFEAGTSTQVETLIDSNAEPNAEPKAEPKVSPKPKVSVKYEPADAYFKTPIGLPPKRVSRPSARLMASLTLKEDLDEARAKSKAAKAKQVKSPANSAYKPKRPSFETVSSDSEASPERPQIVVPKKPKVAQKLLQAATSKQVPPPPPKRLVQSAHLRLQHAQHAARLNRAEQARQKAAQERYDMSKSEPPLQDQHVPNEPRIGYFNRFQKAQRPKADNPQGLQASQQQSQLQRHLADHPLQPQPKPQHRQIQGLARPPKLQPGPRYAPFPAPCAENNYLLKDPKNDTIYDVLVKKSTMAIKNNFIAWVNGELKRLMPAISLAPLYTLPNNVTMWTCADVATFVSTVGYPKTAEYFVQHSIDGVALLLLKQRDLTGLIGLTPFSAGRLFAMLIRMHQNLYNVIMPSMQPTIKRSASNGNQGQPKKEDLDVNQSGTSNETQQQAISSQSGA